MVSLKKLGYVHVNLIISMRHTCTVWLYSAKARFFKTAVIFYLFYVCQRTFIGIPDKL